MKRVLTVQDLSCAGRCSLTVALPVLSCMGCEAVPLPTALLSTHTGFPSPHRVCLTEHLLPVFDHWQTQGVEFSAASVGYMADPDQADTVCALVDRLSCPVVVDPVMGDHGRLYSGLTPEHIPAMVRLCGKGQILLPNITEASLLTGLSYREDGDLSYLRELSEGMLCLGGEYVVITGVTGRAGRIGFFGKGPEGEFSYDDVCIPKAFHGTGDLFCAVLTGGVSQGLSVTDSSVLAARFVARAIQATPCASPFGVAFEGQLTWLAEQLGQGKNY